jgi:hypothetical protein
MQKHLKPEQRLDILRKGDGLRKWYSLDDERVCVMCERIFNGRQIEIVRDQRGRFLLKCPTPGCPSFAAHWFYIGHAATAAAHALRHGESRQQSAAVSSRDRARRRVLADISFASQG